jgi:hypothetical protein|tara:strand:- start:258 stop:416 length:159 start_codon:yes stop_codon:yes gene_type:complete
MRRGRHLGFKKDSLSAEDRSFSRNWCSEFIFALFLTNSEQILAKVIVLALKA